MDFKIVFVFHMYLFSVQLQMFNSFSLQQVDTPRRLKKANRKHDGLLSLYFKMQFITL